MSGLVCEETRGARRAVRGLWALALLVPSTAWAVTTTAFEVEGVKVFEKGKFEGTSALSDGRLVRAPKVAPVALEGVPVAYCSAVDGRGRIFVGTGNEGQIHRIDAQGSAEVAKLEMAVVTSLVSAGELLYAGGMPSKAVWRVDAAGKVSSFAELPGVEQVWALVYDASRKLLYAGTGPEGKVFSIDAKGKATLRFDAEAEHIMSLALGSDGALYAGTSDGALLYRLDGGSAEVVYDFPGDELGAIDVHGGRIAVAANEFPDLPPAPKNSKAKAKAPKLKPGKGQVWVVHPTGRAEKLHEHKDSHVSDVELASDGTVFAALGIQGRVLRIDPDGEHGVWTEVDERQVLSLSLTDDESPHFVASDSAAIYRVEAKADVGVWTSEPLDAETRARWGELALRTEGDVQWQTRSGHTEEANETWSAWSRPSKGPGPVRSPAARYLQIRLSLSGEGAEVRRVEAFYLADNRPARSRNVHVKAPKKTDDDNLIDGVYPVDPERKLEWETDNPDEDALSYRLYLRREGTSRWMPLLQEDELLQEPKYTWDTRTLPDGLYRVRVVTSDAPSNPAAYALESQVTSPLLRVDNHAPVLELKRKGGEIRGRARDDTSRIAAITASVDGGPFLPLAPEDDLLDQRTERFVWKLPQWSPGAHIVAVRATDAAGNARVEQLQIVAGQ